jgi:hypothetical protein
MVGHYTADKPCELPKVLRQLERIDGMLARDKDHYLPLHYVIRPVLGALSNLANEETETKAQISQQSYLLYSELYKAFSQSLPQLIEVVHSLKPKSTRHVPRVGAETQANSALQRI